jgi:hypothetical protein
MNAWSLGSRRVQEPGDFNIENAFTARLALQQVPGFGQIVAGLIRRFRTPLSSIEGRCGCWKTPAFRTINAENSSESSEKSPIN